MRYYEEIKQENSSIAQVSLSEKSASTQDSPSVSQSNSLVNKSCKEEQYYLSQLQERSSSVELKIRNVDDSLVESGY